MIVIGDSLAVGMAPYLPPRAVVDGRVSRPLAEGMALLRGRHDRVLYVSLFTNDDPSHVPELRAAVKQTIRFVGAGGCVVWATINRQGYGKANYYLSHVKSKRYAYVSWNAAYGAHPSWQAGDGIHATSTGYKARAQMYGAALQRCQSRTT